MYVTSKELKKLEKNKFTYRTFHKKMFASMTKVVVSCKTKTSSVQNSISDSGNFLHILPANEFNNKIRALFSSNPSFPDPFVLFQF